MVYLTGGPVEALNAWLKVAQIDSGSVFGKVDRWGNVSPRALEPSAVNAVVKHHAQLAGLDPDEFSAHGMRSGYLTEAANRGIPLPGPWNNRAIAPSSKRRAIITMQHAEVDARHGYLTASAWHFCTVHMQDIRAAWQTCKGNTRVMPYGPLMREC